MGDSPFHGVSRYMQTKKSTITLLLILITLTSCIYIPSFWGDIYMDDYDYILENEDIKNRNWSAYFWKKSKKKRFLQLFKF
jgi:hypothetical protein